MTINYPSKEAVRAQFDYIAGYITSLESRLSTTETENIVNHQHIKEIKEAIEEVRINIMQGFDPKAMRGAMELCISDALKPAGEISDHIEAVIKEIVKDYIEENVNAQLKKILDHVEIDVEARLRHVRSIW